MGQAIGGILPLAIGVDTNNAAIMVVVLLVFGFVLIGQGITGLS